MTIGLDSARPLTESRRVHVFSSQWLGICLLLVGCSWRRPPVEALPPVPVVLPAAGTLRDPSTFESVPGDLERSRALFVEMNQVFTHPRCSNCHPSGESPLQGMHAQLHDPPVTRGAENHGVAGMECGTCHQDHNVEVARVPGAPKWHVAPLEMAWVGRSASQICEQIKDPRRNGGKSLRQIQEHLAFDPLVGWAWHPGHGREPAPGTQQQLGALADAWISTGAACPGEKP